jgi:hypothetical protein
VLHFYYFYVYEEKPEEMTTHGGDGVAPLIFRCGD